MSRRPATARPLPHIEELRGRIFRDFREFAAAIREAIKNPDRASHDKFSPAGNSEKFKERESYENF